MIYFLMKMASHFQEIKLFKKCLILGQMPKFWPSLSFIWEVLSKFKKMMVKLRNLAHCITD